MVLVHAVAFLVSAPSLSSWVRAPGDYAVRAPARAREKLLVVDATIKRTLRDHQYQRDVTFEGVALETLLARTAPEKEDTALLHFENGMVIGLPLSQVAALDAFVATRICDDGCTDELPVAAKQDSYFVDRRPLRFRGVKLAIPAAKLTGYSPYRYADTLTGIELVVGAAYDAQFDVTDAADVATGRALFHARCQACHGVRGVGASFGWDYVKPVALSSYRSPRSLAMHVRHREGDALAKGILMPEFADVDDAAAASVWRLLDAFAKRPLRPYAP